MKVVEITSLRPNARKCLSCTGMLGLRRSEIPGRKAWSDDAETGCSETLIQRCQRLMVVLFHS
jgi:hypothetical protein